MRNKLSAIGIIVTIFFLAGLAQGSTQAYDTDSGKIKLDLPMTLSLTSGSSGNLLDLAKPETVKPIIAIRLQEPYGEDLDKYASSSGFKENRIETTTIDGHALLYFTQQTGNEKQYIAFIDYLDEKNKIIQIWTYSEVHAKGETLATFDSDEVLNIAKSFAFINASEFQALTAENAKRSPGVEIIFAIAGLIGVHFAFRTRRIR